MRTALVAIGRLENQYAVEWTTYHLAQGFDHVYIYDNNRDNEEHFEDVLDMFINEGFVTIVNYRNREAAQRDAYNDAYIRYGKKYEWMAFFDFDEFLCFNEKGRKVETKYRNTATIFQESESPLKAFLRSLPISFHAVMIPWLMMTDSGLIRNDHRPLMERFTESLQQTETQGKCIIRTRLNGARFTKSVHVPYEPELRCCNPSGEPVRQHRLQQPDQRVAYLKHFSTKTVEEWLSNKSRKGTAGRTMERFSRDYKDYFFNINERTPEKEAFIREWDNRPGRVAAVANGRLGNQMFIAVAAMTFARRTGREFVGLVYTGNETRRQFLYPQEQFQTVMRDVRYIEDSEVATFAHMKMDKEHHSQGFPDMGTVRDVVLNDYFQNATLLDRDIALSLFAPRQEVIDEVHRLYGDLSDCVCVNVRRGDYLKHISKGYRVLERNEILAMLYECFPRKDYPRVLFVSDDIEWCRQQFKGDQYLFADRHTVDAGFWKPELDLTIQTQCKGNIISTSTFSWWGAYLGDQENRRVVCPWPWFLPHHEPQLNNILPDNWIKYINRKSQTT